VKKEVVKKNKVLSQKHIPPNPSVQMTNQQFSSLPNCIGHHRKLLDLNRYGPDKYESFFFFNVK
jgi:hypothetical protein